MLSVIIPTLNAGEQLKTLLDGLARARAMLPFEVIVSDGGSIDQTYFVANQGDAIFLEAVRGRGRQLVAGAEAAAGDWLLFLHADTCLDASWVTVVINFMAEQGNNDRAGYFRLALDDERRSARLIEQVVAWRSRFLGLPYGDQGLLVSREMYERLGGYKHVPLMEDVDIVRRIGRRRLVALDSTAITSAAKYRRDGYLIRPLCNLLILGLYRAGVPTRFLYGIYR
ncbi:MAG: glycosyltransferase [Rhodospirillales bacterium]|nr:glycosyltransferase [Rhodospirillales bacterium]